MGQRSDIVKVILINLALGFCCLVVLLAAGEFYLRWAIPMADYRGLYEKTTDQRYYAMKPQMDMIRQGVRIVTNSDGFRDSEFNDKAQRSQFVVAVLGDSYTFGQGVPQEKTYPVFLEERLNADCKTDRFRVWNLGVSGYNTEQESFLLRSFVIPRSPQWVVVGYNINDYEPAYPPEEAKTSAGGQIVAEPSVIRDLLDGNILIASFLKFRIGGLIRVFNPKWFSSSYVDDVMNEYLGEAPGWKRVSRVLTEMNEECQSAGIGFTVAILPAMFDFTNYPFESVNDAIISYLRERGIDYVYVLPYFRSHRPPNVAVSLIDSHPNAYAQKLFADAIADHLCKKEAFQK